jgi:hypothetical protein
MAGPYRPPLLRIGRSYMRRFALNRWWAFVLTLSVLVASSATLSAPSYGDVLSPIRNSSDGGDSGGGGGTTTPRGDPDGPGGPTKSSSDGGGTSSGRTIHVVASAGDGGTAVSVWTWRLHVVLGSLTKGWFKL